MSEIVDDRYENNNNNTKAGNNQVIITHYNLAQIVEIFLF